jgi:hypothetical protein
MIPLRQSDNAKDNYISGRIRQRDGSITPVDDTGFRMQPQPPFTYTRKNVVAATYPTYEYIHNDDVIIVGPGTLRGIPINRVNAISINQEQHDAREAGYLAKRIARSKATADKFWDNDLGCFVSYN